MEYVDIPADKAAISLVITEMLPEIKDLTGYIPGNYRTWFFRNTEQIKAENKVKSVLGRRREIWNKIKLDKKCLPADILEKLSN